ncbi:MAG: flagellar basal body P-ring formation chaperone FlgA [Nitrospiraceae bacterium]
MHCLLKLLIILMVFWCNNSGQADASGTHDRPTVLRASSVQSVSTGKEVSRMRQGQILYPENFRKAIRLHLQKEFSGKVREIQIVLGEPQQPLVIPSGVSTITVSSSDADESVGRRVFQLHIAVNGALHKTIEATADVSAFLDVLTPVRLIRADEEIESQDVAMTRVALFDLRIPYATDLKELIGKAATRPLPPQAPIRLTALRRPFVVRKGDRVTIEAKMGGLSIQTVGSTKSNGELGQTITVANSDSGKELRAKVVAPGVVRVDF